MVATSWYFVARGSTILRLPCAGFFSVHLRASKEPGPRSETSAPVPRSRGKILLLLSPDMPMVDIVGIVITTTKADRSSLLRTTTGHQLPTTHYCPFSGL